MKYEFEEKIEEILKESNEIISEETDMKLFVWAEFLPDIVDGLAFAVARNEKEAKKLVISSMGLNPSNWGPIQVLPLNKPVGFGVHGCG
jgi:hypothetical protein